MTGIVYGSLTGALIFCLIFAYHYYNTGERYLRLWSAAWGLNFLAHLFFLNAYLAETQLLSSIFLFHTAYLSGTLLFLYGIYSFLQETISRKWLYAAALVLVTGLIFTVILNNPIYLNTFSLILIGLIYISMGGKLWRRADFSLMKIVGITSILFGFNNIFYPYFVRQNWFMSPVQIILAALGLIFALGLRGFHYKKIEEKLDKTMKDLQEKKEKLENSEKRYRTIFNSAPIGIMIEDKNGNILEANTTMEEMTGIKTEKLEGSNVLDEFVSPENQEEARENIASLLQEELQNKNILLTSILESIQDGISVLNPDLTIRYTNSTIQEWYADSKPLSGKKCFQAYHENISPCQDCPALRSLESGEVEKEVVPGISDSEIDYLELHAYPIFDENNEEITGIVEFVRDITDRKQQKRELELTKFSIDRADLMIMRTTSEGEVRYANETTVRKLGYSKEELIGTRGEDFIAEADYVDREQFWQKIKESESIVYEREMITKNGEKFPAEITSQYYQYEDEEFEFVFARDITERKNKEQEIQYLLYRDPLTDLYNRRFMQEEMQRLDTERQLPISIIMVDINGLKIINDSFGHDKGDELLVKTAGVLQETVREEDILARYGGDEFVVLLPQTSEKFARKIVKRIKDKCQKTRNEELTISIGAGVATKKKKDKSLEDILKQADDNMYKDKLVSSRSRKHEVVEGLLNTLAANSSETINHARRMEKLAKKLGKRLGLSESQLNRLSLLATLHDIGKASIDKEILTKPEELTEEEWEIVKEHAQRGYKIASASEEFALVAEEILSHHEWWNGQGYPQGLQGKEIPLLARIISLLDAYDVMTNDRPYKKAKSQDEALEEIKNCAGSQFDPNLAEEFISMLK